MDMLSKLTTLFQQALETVSYGEFQELSFVLTLAVCELLTIDDGFFRVDETFQSLVLRPIGNVAV